ncbi:MAG: hypothetical protein HQL50_05315 [Magnetococcales bacterium]|nr:hypothetical protein [Magnetococcales bacterium]
MVTSESAAKGENRARRTGWILAITTLLAVTLGILTLYHTWMGSAGESKQQHDAESPPTPHQQESPPTPHQQKTGGDRKPAAVVRSATVQDSQGRRDVKPLYYQKRHPEHVLFVKYLAYNNDDFTFKGKLTVHSLAPLSATLSLRNLRGDPRKMLAIANQWIRIPPERLQQIPISHIDANGVSLIYSGDEAHLAIDALTSAHGSISGISALWQPSGAWSVELEKARLDTLPLSWLRQLHGIIPVQLSAVPDAPQQPVVPVNLRLEMLHLMGGKGHVRNGERLTVSMKSSHLGGIYFKGLLAHLEIHHSGNSNAYLPGLSIATGVRGHWRLVLSEAELDLTRMTTASQKALASVSQWNQPIVVGRSRAMTHLLNTLQPSGVARLSNVDLSSAWSRDQPVLQSLKTLRGAAIVTGRKLSVTLPRWKSSQSEAARRATLEKAKLQITARQKEISLIGSSKSVTTPLTSFSNFETSVTGHHRGEGLQLHAHGTVSNLLDRTGVLFKSPKSSMTSKRNAPTRRRLDPATLPTGTPQRNDLTFQGEGTLTESPSRRFPSLKGRIEWQGVANGEIIKGIADLTQQEPLRRSSL